MHKGPVSPEDRLSQIVNTVETSCYSKPHFFGRIYNRIYKWINYQIYKGIIKEIQQNLLQDPQLQEESAIEKYKNIKLTDIRSELYPNSKVLEDIQKIEKWAFYGESRTILQGEKRAYNDFLSHAEDLKKFNSELNVLLEQMIKKSFSQEQITFIKEQLLPLIFKLTDRLNQKEHKGLNDLYIKEHYEQILSFLRETREEIASLSNNPLIKHNPYAELYDSIKEINLDRENIDPRIVMNTFCIEAKLLVSEK